MKPDKPWYNNVCYLKKEKKFKKINLLKNVEVPRVPRLNLAVGPGVPLLNFDGGPGS